MDIDKQDNICAAASTQETSLLISALKKPHSSDVADTEIKYIAVDSSAYMWKTAHKSAVSAAAVRKRSFWPTYWPTWAAQMAKLAEGL